MKPRHRHFPHQFHLYRLQHDQGFTLVEVLVTAVAAVAILVGSLGAINAQRQSFLGDRDRIAVNGNLRVAMGLVGDDIKQAGERLEKLQPDFTAVSVINGSPTGPDRIILQRRKLTETLTICSDVNAGNGTIDVADAKDDPNCTGSAANPNVLKWQAERCSFNTVKTACDGSAGEKLWAYIYNPTGNPSGFLRNGEFIRITNAVKGICTAGGADCWRFTLDVKPTLYNYTKTTADSTQPKLYVLEQKEYRLTPDLKTARTDDNVLELVTNSQTSPTSVLPPQRLTNLIADMQIRVRTVDAGVETWLDQFNYPVPSSSPPQFKSPGQNPLILWQTIGGVEVKLKGLNVADTTAQLSAAQLTLESQFLPRNVISITN